MTEYTGWDNWVKEQEQKSTEWDKYWNDPFGFLAKKKSFIHASQKDISRLEDKIKHLEESQEVTTNTLLNHECWEKSRIALGHDKRIKDLESKVDQNQKDNDLDFDYVKRYLKNLPDANILRESASQLNQRVKDIELKVNNLVSWNVGQDERIKALEEWKERYIKELGDNPDARLEDIGPHSKGIVMDRVRECERLIKDLKTLLIEHVQNTREGYFTPEILKTHTDRIKTLEEKVNDFDNCPNTKETISRIEKLEEWKKEHMQWVKLHIDDHRFNGDDQRMLRRIHDLEEWTKLVNLGQIPPHITDRLDKLEEWKKNTLEHRFGQRINELEDNTEDLEEWKRNLEDYHNKSNPRLEEWLHEHITIDKRVWEDIKSDVRMLNNIAFGGGFHKTFENLKESIKKADPSWCPND